MRTLLLVAASLLIAAQPQPAPAPEPAPAADPLAATPPAAEDEGSRVVRGTPAQPGSSPWQIQVYFTKPLTPKEIAASIARAGSEVERQALRTMEDWERDHLCGGALIDTEWALSAAHCFVADNRETLVKLPNMGVRLGNIDLKAATPMRIDRIIVHGDYRRFGHKQHDIALLHLVPDRATRPEIAAAAAPVRLIGARMRPLTPGDDLKVTGWGHVSERKAGQTRSVTGAAMRSSQVLLEGRLELLDPSECAKVPDYARTLNPGVLCVGAGTSAQQDSCQGDSGGPLTRQRILVGLVSTGVGCGRKGVPALYTNVAYYADWIAAVQEQAKVNGVTRCVVAAGGRLTCSAKLNQPRTNRG